MEETPHPVLYFDGDCNLCNRSVQFVLRHDRKGIFRFTQLQSASAAQMLQQQDITADSVVLGYKGKYYVKSDAVLKLSALLGGWFKLLLAGYIIPRFIRNRLYDFIAAHRYKWFGKNDHCLLPKPEWKERFI
ncbi:thiol-disulfide oxidoreductase DCC family protein [Chitinophagaceae bacterium MMS25-I14]